MLTEVQAIIKVQHGYASVHGAKGRPANAQVQILKLPTNCLLIGGFSPENPNLHYLRFQDC